MGQGGGDEHPILNLHSRIANGLAYPWQRVLTWLLEQASFLGRALQLHCSPELVGQRLLLEAEEVMAQGERPQGPAALAEQEGQEHSLG